MRPTEKARKLSLRLSRLPFKIKRKTTRFFNTVIGSSLPKYFQYFHPVRDITQLQSSQRKNSVLSVILGIFTILLGYLDVELTYRSNYSSTNLSAVVRLFVITFTLFQLMLTFKYYLSHLNIKKAYKTISTETTFYQEKSTRFWFILESLFACPCMPPLIDYTYKFYQLNTYSILGVNEILFALLCLRLLHIVKLMHEMSHLHTTKSIFYCKLQNNPPGLSFTVKGWVMERPVLCVGVTVLLTGVVAGVLLSVFERNVPGTRLDNLYNGIWFCFITQTTVGYGEIIPATHIGRFICSISAILGMFYQSMIMLITQKFFNLDSIEVVYCRKVLTRKTITTKLLKEGILLIQRFCRLRKKRVKMEKRLIEVKMLGLQLKLFSELRLNLRVEKQPNTIQAMEDSEQHMKSTVNKLSKNLNGIDEVRLSGSTALKTQHRILQQINSIQEALGRLLGEDSMINEYHRSHGNPRKIAHVEKVFESRKKLFESLINSSSRSSVSSLRLSGSH